MQRAGLNKVPVQMVQVRNGTTLIPDSSPSAPRMKGCRMPRYYFDIHDGQRLTHDEEGSDCADAEAAREEAIRTLPSIAREVPLDDGKVEMWVKVRSESGKDIARVSLTLTSEWLG